MNRVLSFVRSQVGMQGILKGKKSVSIIILCQPGDVLLVSNSVFVSFLNLYKGDHVRRCMQVETTTHMNRLDY